MGAGKKKGCKLILENPHGGILVKHVGKGIPPSCWDRCAASVLGAERRLLCLPPSAEKPLILGSSSSPLLEAGAGFCWSRFPLAFK